MSPVVGICGTGNMGSAIGARLIEHGIRVVTALDGRSARSAALARAAGIEDLGTIEQLVAEVDILLSIMGSASARSFAEKVAAAATPDRDLLFIECNPMIPREMKGLAAELSQPGLRIVDAGISGPTPTAMRQPIIYASGQHASDFAVLGQYGLNISIIGSEIGNASALKICTAATWQGAVALASEVYLVAEHYGFTELLLDDMKALQPNLFAWLQQAIPEMPAKAARWSGDMRGVSTTIAESGGQGLFHDAAAHFYARIRDVDQSWNEMTDIASVVTRLSTNIEPQNGGKA